MSMTKPENRFKIVDLPLSKLKLIEHKPIGDNRGFLTRLFCREELQQAGWDESIAQINHTYTARKGTVRGMHFQHPPHSEKKLISCLRGHIWDVAVDLRQDSPTFMQWHAEKLSAGSHHALLIPEGFAHGFQTLSDDVELLYFHSVSYCRDSEGGLNVMDPKLNIDWPMPISEISERDQKHAMITASFTGLSLS